MQRKVVYTEERVRALFARCRALSTGKRGAAMMKYDNGFSQWDFGKKARLGFVSDVYDLHKEADYNQRKRSAFCCRSCVRTACI